MKKYEIFAGVNGAGKSTLYATKHVSLSEYRVNTDEILRDLGDWRDTSLLAIRMQMWNVDMRRV